MLADELAERVERRVVAPPVVTLMTVASHDFVYERVDVVDAEQSAVAEGATECAVQLGMESDLEHPMGSRRVSCRVRESCEV
jgi:hypothetical protein